MTSGGREERERDGALVHLPHSYALTVNHLTPKPLDSRPERTRVIFPSAARLNQR